MNRKVKIGVDLDGVIVGKPFLVPKSLLEWLVRNHHKNGSKKYRFPKLKAEIKLRVLSHHHFFRPPLRKNLKVISRLESNPKIILYFVSSRYSFLEKRTKEWFQNYFPNFDFKKVFLNLENQQPHIFKEKKVKTLGLDYFFDDDPVAVNYLKSKIKKTKIFHVTREPKKWLKDQELYSF